MQSPTDPQDIVTDYLNFDEDVTPTQTNVVNSPAQSPQSPDKAEPSLHLSQEASFAIQILQNSIATLKSVKRGPQLPDLILRVFPTLQTTFNTVQQKLDKEVQDISKRYADSVAGGSNESSEGGGTYEHFQELLGRIDKYRVDFMSDFSHLHEVAMESETRKPDEAATRRSTSS